MQVVSYRPQYVEKTLLQNKCKKKEKEERKFANSSRKSTNQGKLGLQTTTITNTTEYGLTMTFTSPSCYTLTNTNNEVPLPLQQYYCKDVANNDVDDDAAEICINPRNCNSWRLAATTTDVNYKKITKLNCNNSSNQSSNKFLNSIISILHCKQFKPKLQQHVQQQQQQYVQQQNQQQLKEQQLYHSHHYFTSTSSKTTTMTSTSTHPSHFHKLQTPTTGRQQQHHQQQQQQNLLSYLYNCNNNFYKDLVYIMYIIVIFYLLHTSLLNLPLMVDASCRDESSRSCEAICRPIWSQDNYLSTMMHHSNLTLEPFQADDYNCTIRALVLLPDDDRYLASLRRVVPILKVAEQLIHASGLLPSYIQFDWMPQDDKCDAAFATVKAMDGIVRNCAHVVFGPVCDYPLAAVGRIAKYFNSDGTPLISVGGSTFDFEKPKTKCTDEFYMLLRTGMLSFETMSELTISVMKRNNWSRSIFFYDRDGQRNVAGLHTCYLMMTSLGEQMRKENMTFAQHPIQAKLKNRTEEMIREIGNKNTSK